MEQTPLPPLVSDKEITRNATAQSNALMQFHNDDFAAGERARGYVNGAVDMKTIYEADRQRTREVVQALVDAVNRAERCIDGAHAGQHSFLPGQYKDWKLFRHTALSLAKSINIEPTK